MEYNNYICINKLTNIFNMKLLINTITGHLTVTNKKHITAMLDKKMLSAKVNTINYHLTLNNDIYSVSIIKFESITIGEKPKQTLFKATFKINTK